MRLAIFCDLPDGGARQATLAIIRGLATRHQVDLYTYADSSASLFDLKQFAHTTYSYPLVLPHLPLPARLNKDLQAFVSARRLDAKIAHDIERCRYDAVIVSHTRFLQAPWILRYLRSGSVFLCQEPTRAFFESFLAPDPSWPLPNRLYETCLRRLKKRSEITNASCAGLIVANSRYSVRAIRRAYGVTSTPITLGVDPIKFYPVPGTKRHQVMVVGNDEPQKALDFAVRAVGGINIDLRPDLVIVSPRRLLSRSLRVLATSLGVKLIPHHRLDTSALRTLYSRSLLTLAVARTEPFGLSVLESMACGTPVLAVAEGGFTETILDSRTGWLVPRHLSRYTAKLADLLSHPSSLVAASKACVAHVKTNYTWEKTVTELETFLNSAPAKNLSRTPSPGHRVKR